MISSDQLEHSLDTYKGLTDEEVARSRNAHGSNRLTEIRGRSFFEMVRNALDDKTLKILIGAAAIVIAIDLFTGGTFVDGLAILVAVAVATLAQAYNDWRAQTEFKSLQVERESGQVRAVRNGEKTLISSFDLVVGDVVHLEAGDKVPVDCRLVTGTELLVDESLLTGESEAVRKAPKSFGEAFDEGVHGMLGGTVILEGRATCVVTAVGERTEYGRLRAQLGGEREPTPLQARLGRLADRIGVLGLSAAILIFAMLTLAGLFRGELGFDLNGVRQLIAYAVLGVTIVVVAVPEGLPVAVTLSLAYSVLRMARDKVLVRRLVACETMGAADVICADKTGTLTQNRMTAQRIAWMGDGVSEASPEAVPDWLKDDMSVVAAMNSTADLDRRSGAGPMGNPTEGALLALCEGWGKDYLAIRNEHQILDVLAFSSERKRMSTITVSEAGERLLCKGAPEVVLPLCNRVYTADGRAVEAEGWRESIGRVIDGWNEQALRTLVLATRDLPADDAGEPEQDLVFVAAVAIGDPLRDDVSEAISECRRAGIDVRMITGDAKKTAAAIGEKLGLVDRSDVVIEAGELRDKSDEVALSMLGRLRVIARSIPSDKLRVVKLFQAAGHTVAVTGDGTNDAPALRHADVGVAMGRSGTDVAREAADIVLVDDSFSSIVRAVRWGRTVYRNIQRFLQFQLTVSLVALCVAFVAGIAGYGTPLGVVQLLWINLIMDTLAALALTVDAPEGRLSGTPHGRRTPLITRDMWVRIVGFGAMMVVALLSVLFLGGDAGDKALATLVFNCFVWLQVGNLINSRATSLTESPFRGLFRSRFFLVIFLIIVGIQVIVVEFGGRFFQTVPLNASEWALSVSFGVGIVAAGALLRAAAPTLLGLMDRHGASVQQRAGLLVSRVRGALRAPASTGPRGVIGLLGVVAILAGMATRPMGPEWTALGYALFSGGASAVGCWAWLRRRDAVGVKASALRRYAAMSIGLAIALIAIGNYISSRHYRRYDLTVEKRFELSPQTQGVLDRLTSPVRVTMLFRAGTLKTYVHDLLAEYAARNVLVQIHDLDPDRDPGEVARLKDRLGISTPRLSSLILEHNGKSRVITRNELLPRTYQYKGGRRYLVRNAPTRFRGEEAVSSAIVALVSDAPTKVCFLTGHGERNPDEFGDEGLAMVRDHLRREGYIVEAVNAFLDLPSPDSCQIIVQAGPKHAVSERTKRQLDAYLASGGKWMLMVEPWQTGGLDDLLKKWNVGVRSVYLSDPASRAAGVGPTTLVATNYLDHPITSSLLGAPVFFPYATSVRYVQGRRALEGANLVLTSKKGIGESTQGSAARYDSKADAQGDLAIAVAIDEPPNLYAADGRREPARLVVVGDVDFATNIHLHRGANGDFFLNSVDWLARREELIAVRARTPEIRRLSLSASDQTALYWLSLGVIPAAVVMLGVFVAWRRRS